MKSSWILGLMLVAVAASFVNLIWETLDYGFPDDLRRPVSEKVRIGLLNEPEILSFKSTYLVLLKQIVFVFLTCMKESHPSVRRGRVMYAKYFNLLAPAPKYNHYLNR